MEKKFDINEARAKATFIELVSVPCPSGDEKEEADLLVKKLTEMGLEVKVDEAGKKCGGTTGNVWGFLPGNVEGATRLFFEAHMDSVAPTTGTKVVCKDGIMYSDGTTTLGGDDKVGIVAGLEAVQTIIENDIPHGDVQLCFTIGEETGSNGVRFMDPSWIKADAGYSLDCGGKPGLIFNASPKAMDLYFTIKGKSAHAGLEPEKGVNAIMLAVKALAKLPNYGRLDETTTMSIDLINGGLASNIVPEECTFVVDMRCPEVEKLEKLKNELIATVKETVEAGGGQMEVREEGVAPAVFLREDEPAVKMAADAAKKCGFEVKYQFTGGCSDANHLCGMGLPSVMLATGMDKIHTTKEQLAEVDLYDTCRWTLAIIQEAAATKRA